jgi:hypothetical protein
MAIRIPILTSFDPKGLKQANAQFAKLQTSIGSLGRNFAIAGTAVVAGTALLGKAVKSASNFEAEFEGVNQVFGEAAKSVQAFAEQAAQSAGLSATEALQASKTFGLFATGAGLGAEEAAKFSTTMVQLAGDLGSFNDVPTAEALAAIQSGLMGQSEPLRKFGVFLDDARLKQEALNMGIYDGTGPLSTQQKMMASYSAILAQTTVQQGDFVKYQDTLGNQLKTISTEFDNLTKDIGLMLIPAITAALPQIKEMARSIGEELKAAIAAVDWESLTKTVVGLIGFFAENAETILKVVTAIFALNTAYKLMQVAIGITTVALEINKWWLAKVATGMTLTTVAAGVLRTAMLLLPWGLAIAGIGLLVTALVTAKDGFEQTNLKVLTFEDGLIKSGQSARRAADQYVMVAGAIKKVADAAASTPSVRPDMTGYAAGFQARLDRQNAGSSGANTGVVAAIGGGGGGSSSNPKTVSQVLKREGTLATREAKLLKAGVSEGLAGLIVSTATTKKTFQKELAKITKSPAALTKAQNKFNKTAAGRAEVANNAAEAAASAAAAAAESAAAMREAQQQANQELAEAARAQADALQAEADALAERERVYQSFANSVKDTFGSIKNSILGAFDLTQLGGSTNAITRNMDKLLVRLKGFATNISKLSGMGLNAALLQQVISAGPMAGARLAESLVMGGTGALAAINAGYSEFGNLAGQIATTGTNAMFGSQAQQTVYNINVDGGVGSGATIGKAIVDAIKAYERTSGAVWQGA